MPLTGARERLIVFAKAPRPGAVKTRLIPHLGASGAAELHARLIEHTLATARTLADVEFELHGSATDDEGLRACARKHGIALIAQAEGDLGARMHAAFTRALVTDRCSAVVLIGSDCPAITARFLHDAFERLRDGCDAVLGPAEDGGYVLVGLTQPAPALFAGIEWSTAAVMEQTRDRLRQLQWRWHELPTLWDVDRPADYERLAREPEIGCLFKALGKK
jgi:rSAM/selenodomain-associated transferase 1